MRGTKEEEKESRRETQSSVREVFGGKCGILETKQRKSVKEERIINHQMLLMGQVIWGMRVRNWI